MFKNIPNYEKMPPILGEKNIGNGMKHAQPVQCQHTTTYGEKNIHKQTSEKKQEKKQKHTQNIISHPPTPKTPFLFMVLTKTKQTFLSFLSWKFPNKNKQNGFFVVVRMVVNSVAVGFGGGCEN